MEHLKQIAARLDEYKLDAMLITSASGERYALGFNGEGLLLVARDKAHYTTDGRYIEAAQERIKGVVPGLINQKNGSHLAQAAAFLRENGLHRVGFESGSMTVDDQIRHAKELPCELIPAQGLLEGLRASKDEDELDAMRHAQKITDDSFTAILDFIRPGVTEREIAARLTYEMLLRGAEKMSFQPIAAAGPNGSMPHAIPSDRKVEPGMFITMDFGCIVDGYCSDMTRSVAVGKPTEEMEKVYNIVLAAQEAGIRTFRAGVAGREVDAAARKVIADAGYGRYFSHSFGHSLGLDVHEPPFAGPSEQRPLPAGAVVSAEPGIYIPGRFGVRIEDAIVVREGGSEDLAHSPKNLIVL